VSTIAKCRLFTEEALLLPRNDVGDTDFDCHRAPGTRILLGRVRYRDVLNDERFTAANLRTTATRRSIQLEGHMLVAFRTIAPGH